MCLYFTPLLPPTLPMAPNQGHLEFMTSSTSTFLVDMHIYNQFYQLSIAWLLHKTCKDNTSPHANMGRGKVHKAPPMDGEVKTVDVC